MQLLVKLFLNYKIISYDLKKYFNLFSYEITALECYTCGFMEGAPTEEFEKMEGFDKSCKSGKKPKKDLNKACPANYTRMPIFFNLLCTISYIEDML